MNLLDESRERGGHRHLCRKRVHDVLCKHTLLLRCYTKFNESSGMEIVHELVKNRRQRLVLGEQVRIFLYQIRPALLEPPGSLRMLPRLTPTQFLYPERNLNSTKLDDPNLIVTVVLSN